MDFCWTSSKETTLNKKYLYIFELFTDADEDEYCSNIFYWFRCSLEEAGQWDVDRILTATFLTAKLIWGLYIICKRPFDNAKMWTLTLILMMYKNTLFKIVAVACFEPLFCHLLHQIIWNLEWCSWILDNL